MSVVTVMPEYGIRRRNGAPQHPLRKVPGRELAAGDGERAHVPFAVLGDDPQPADAGVGHLRVADQDQLGRALGA